MPFPFEPDPVCIPISPEADPSELLAENFSLKSDTLSATSYKVYDSFDRRIQKAGLCLINHEQTYYLASASDLHSGRQPGGKSRLKRKVSWKDFSPSPFRETLKKLLDLRVATPLYTFESESAAFTVRNRDEKIVARLSVESLRVPQSPESQRSLTISPLIGYDDEAQKIADILKAKLPLPEEEPASLSDFLLKSAGKETPPLSAKSNVALEPTLETHSAIAQIVAQTIEVVRQNEKGIIEDIDTEFLHDYRVAIRKIRSVLSLVKGAFPPEETKKLKQFFGEFARITNGLRDRDVYLLAEETYRAMLPPDLQPPLRPFFDDLKTERHRELLKVQQHLKSPNYQKAISACQDCFSQEALPEGKRAKLPILSVASNEIRKHYKHVCQLGRSITSETPDKEVHQLRIECKKLRYLLELFAGLFPSEQIDFVSKKLRRLQNTLGNFNDYSVQYEFLVHYLQHKRKIVPQTAASVGGLVTELHRAQKNARSQIAKRFEEFYDDKTKEQMTRLLSLEKEASA